MTAKERADAFLDKHGEMWDCDAHAEILAAAFAEAEQAAREAAGWQPIDTAPKDSTAILVWCPERQNTYAVVWDTQYGSWCIWGGWRKLHETPSHWLPLSALPPRPEQSSCPTPSAASASPSAFASAAGLVVSRRIVKAD